MILDKILFLVYNGIVIKKKKHFVLLLVSGSKSVSYADLEPSLHSTVSAARVTWTKHIKIAYAIIISYEKYLVKALRLNFRNVFFFDK